MDAARSRGIIKYYLESRLFPPKRETQCIFVCVREHVGARLHCQCCHSVWAASLVCSIRCSLTLGETKTGIDFNIWNISVHFVIFSDTICVIVKHLRMNHFISLIIDTTTELALPQFTQSTLKSSLSAQTITT